jgi:hypothetical protein
MKSLPDQKKLLRPAAGESLKGTGSTAAEAPVSAIASFNSSIPFLALKTPGCLWRIAKKMDSADYEFEWDREFPQLRVSMEQILPTSTQGASFMRGYRWNGPDSEIFQHNGKREFLKYQAASGV